MLTSNERAQTRLGDYRLTAELSSGPSGRTYLAEHIGSSEVSRQPVVIKWLYTTLLRGQQEKDTFFREIYRLRQLRHPHLLPILSAGIEGDTPYIVVAYAPNRSLRDRLQATPYSPLLQDEALTILAQVGRALQYLHYQQIVHGDLKPQNILFNEKGEALLADCHLDCLLPPPPPAPPIDPFKTPAFEEPDLSGGRFSKENDQYALGEIAYEMFTGRKPFTAPSLSNPGIQFRTKTLIAPTKLKPVLPPFIEEVILKAMAKEPMQRYHNIQTFLIALGVAPATSLLEELAASPASLSPAADAATPVQSDFAEGDPNEMTMPVFAEDMPTSNIASAMPGMGAAQQSPLFLAPAASPADAQAPQPFASSEAYPQPPIFVSNSRAAAPSYGGLARGRQLLKRRDMLLVLVTCGLVVAIVIGGLALLLFSPHTSNPNPAASTGQTIADATQTAASATTAPTATPVPTPTPTLAPTPTPVPVLLNPTPTPLPTPTPGTSITDGFTTSPTALNASTCNRSKGFGGRFTCTITLKLGARFPQAESWTASSSGLFAQFNPSSGQLNPGQAVRVTVNIFTVCPSNGTLTFSGAQTQASVPWRC